MATGVDPIDDDTSEESERLAELEVQYSDLLDKCAEERRDGEVLLEALHLIAERGHEFDWVDLDEAADLCDVLSRRMRQVREQPGQLSTEALLDSLVQGSGTALRSVSDRPSAATSIE